ncbi:MAG: polysaccharide lyase, partial [Billgrantia desiderata]
MKLPTTAKERSTVGMYTGLLLGGLTLLPAAASHSDEGADALVGIPQVEACSQRYRAIETPRPRQAADAAYRDGHASVRQNFHTTRHWGTDENVERLGTGQTGIDEPGLRVHYPAGTSSPGEEPRGGAGF